MAVLTREIITQDTRKEARNGAKTQNREKKTG